MKNILLNFAVTLERISVEIKNNVNRKATVQFLEEYLLKDGAKKEKTDVRYNPYEGTSLLLIDKLIDSGEIKKTEKILDIGCGAGIFLLYLASKGFMNLQGIEMDIDLFNLCNKNVEKYKIKSGFKNQIIKIFHGNAVETAIDDNITCFYLFNTFYDKDTYLTWLHQIESSLKRNKRHIKIIILYPTVASMGAMRTCKWLREKRRVICKSLVCYRCMHFLIYESVG